MKKEVTQIFTFIFVMFLMSCSEDFLDRPPLGFETENSFYSNAEGAIRAVNACYDGLTPMPERQYYSVHHVIMADCASPDSEVGGQEGGGDRIELQEIGKFIAVPDNVVFQDYWKWSYQGIFRCNTVTSKVAGIDMDENLKNRLLSEAKFLKAVFYMNLAMVFKTVPAFDEPLNPSEYKLTQSTRVELWKLIEKNLNEAIPHLPKSYSDSDKGRATWGAAKALLTKACVFIASYKKNDPSFDPSNVYNASEKWEEALKHAQDVIDEGVYELVGLNGETFDTYFGSATPGYKYIFTGQGEDSKEHIFSINALGDGLGASETNGLIATVYQGGRRIIPVDDPTQTVINGPGWGFNCPSTEFSDAMDHDDPRYQIAVAEDGDTLDYMDENGDIKKAVYTNYESPSGYHHEKLQGHPLEWNWGEHHASPIDIKLIRYADLVLWAAEAALESGNSGDALNYINLVRKRARMSGNTNKPQDLTSVTLKDIQDERRWELAFEGHRLFDLVRWGIAAEECQEAGLPFVKGKHEFFPIPSSEIQMSGNKLVQNPGYN